MRPLLFAGESTITHGCPTLSPTGIPTFVIANWNCDANGNPIQIYKADGESIFQVAELDLDTGVYDRLYDLDFIPYNLNAAAMHESADGVTVTPWLTQGERPNGANARLCKFDNSNYLCLSELLMLTIPNVGAFIGNTYYYGYGRPHYWVKDMHTDTPIVGSVYDNVNKNLFTSGSIVDITDLVEDGTDYVLDGDGGSGRYLVGLDRAAGVFVQKIDVDGNWGDYAHVTGTSVDWGPSQSGTTAFGAAYTFTGSGTPRVFFSANDGRGILELQLPITIPDSSGCWNDISASTNTHASCSAGSLGGVTLAWVAKSATTGFNDGMNCPSAIIDIPSEQTPSPTTSPTAPTGSPTNSPTGSPTAEPTVTPTTSPTAAPTPAPTTSPTVTPSASPTTATNTFNPTPAPTGEGCSLGELEMANANLV